MHLQERKGEALSAIGGIKKKLQARLLCHHVPKHFFTTSKEHNNYVAKMWKRADETNPTPDASLTMGGSEIKHVLLILFPGSSVPVSRVPHKQPPSLVPSLNTFQVATEDGNFMCKNV